MLPSQNSYWVCKILLQQVLFIRLQKFYVNIKLKKLIMVKKNIFKNFIFSFFKQIRSIINLFVKAETQVLSNLGL